MRSIRCVATLAIAVALTACGGGTASSDVNDAVAAPSAPSPIDTIAPTISVTSPSANGVYATSSATIAVEGVASDNVAVKTVKWVNDRGGSGAASGQEQWSIAAVALQSGANVLTFTASDAAGNTSRAALTVTYTPPAGSGQDTQRPAIAVTAPSTSGTFTTGNPTVSVSGTASDNVGVTQVSWTSDRGGSGTANGLASWTGSIPLLQGANALTFSARDAAGNAAIVTLTVTYNVADATAPTISITVPTSGNSYASATSSIAVSGIASDNVGVTQITWTSDRGGSGAATGTSAWSVASVLLQLGSNVLTFTARDAAANTTQKTLTVSYANGAAQSYYLSPSGSDANDGISAATPLKSFARAFSRMQAGDELVLLDGVYSAAAGTGTIHWNNGSASAQIPAGSASRATVVRAQNPGSVTIQGPLFVGRSTRKDSYIRIQGITFEGGGSLYNTSFVTLKDDGFHGPLDVGTNDHDQGNTDNLVEDVWVWTSGQRAIAMNYRAHRNVWRRVVVRGDGCGTAACSGSGNPNVGFTVYDSMDVSVQNMLVVDRVLSGSDEPYADFACAQHTPDPRYYFGRNEWLGIMSLNSPDVGFYCEPDAGATLDPVVTIRDSVFWNARYGGVNLARSGKGHVIERLWIRSGGDGFRFAPELAQSGARINGLTITGAGRFALNTSIAATEASISGAWDSAMNQEGCEAGCSVTHAATGGDTSLPPGLRLVRYGVDGSRFRSPGYHEPSAEALLPWPNEERIRREVCRGTSRGFCADGMTLSGYLTGDPRRSPDPARGTR